jgi:urea transport system ATP-binding protein
VSEASDGFRAHQQAEPGHRSRRAALHHPNGAGKTTMMDIITGKTRPNEGIVFSAARLTCCGTRSRNRAAGHCRKFQKPTVFEQLTCWKTRSWH